ncbi:type I-E CRISPR-associated protein Cas5/CasD [Nocardia terpenica]|uniref:type I-E CRISPR-associated protein Cas5/CasD n=1 Tax=Nocardia terpenica TaxID=455432 RepID=UPI001895CB6A|nr:type I-E CRISPR-associated protein Cas5/CasD [Nocardia terpenica]MBF6063512.1 type I-E CRISPR-associated protein Cas5/CasD [Nocardia terpenica]MBF6106068.1 type I-E CRISPR-associated protein Cas5/CasD [Nocardia terpenica]MBF6113347.1 type I-E CRISPR-associated protein Cas5/CasD [Nocardia terpenica]MBF6119809.1 type I-E CRISPR-associated protein Cas5/CasD [Nocardia terpenica]MBF6152220.1 type I-E CRISPR-associated protein Cas5/CasD [Nocardia terpenica]
MTGLVLRLAGPLQSWGEHSAFSLRDTQRFPTRSGLIGLFASARGLDRGQPLTRFDPLRLTVRIDRPGAIITDFHTIGGGNEPARTVPTAEGKRRAAGKGTIVTRRNYLSDAVFTVAVDGPDTVVGELATELAAPRWQPYLGRRSCPPEHPLLLRTDVADPVHDLKYHVPIHDSRRDSIDIVTEDGDPAGTTTTLADVPVTFDPLQRRYRNRSVTTTPFTETPNTLWHRDIGDYYEALFAYMGVA